MAAVKITVRLDDVWAERLKLLALVAGRAQADIVREALADLWAARQADAQWRARFDMVINKMAGAWTG